MRDFVRFPLTAADQATIASTVQAEDVPTTATPGAGQPYPQSLKLTFAAPAALPQVRALFPGSLTFVAAGDAPGTLPDWTVVSRAGYAGYKTVGALLVTMVAGRSLTNAYAEHGSALPVLPNAVWYAPINVTEEFLFETLLNLKGVVSHGGATVPRSSPDWIKHAVAAFLRGSYRPEVRLGGSAADDSVAKRAMPEVRAEAGQVTLYVTMARRETPKDGPSQRFDDLTRELVSTTTEPTSPRHLRNAALPARWVLRGFLPKLVDGAGPVATAVLAGAAPVRYATLRFTRTWLHQVPVAGHPARPLSTASVHLPTQTVEVKGPASAVVHQQRLPAHGIVVLKDPPAQITVAVLGDSRFLSGGPTAWHTAAATAPLTFDLGQTPAPHVIVRRQIPHEMMADTSRPKEHPDCEVSTCTYWSLRRTLRGMVDHYLTGGRLNWETQGAPARPRAVRSALANVVDLLKAAWGNASAMIDGQQHPIWQLMTTHQPSLNVITLEDLRREQRKLLAVLDTLFPDPAGPGASAPSQGEVFYFLWQSVTDEFKAPATQAFYSVQDKGRGAVGAAHSLGLTTYHFDPTPLQNESADVYADRIARQMRAGLQPGDLLQFWTLIENFERVRAGQKPECPQHGIECEGHSPMFSHYDVDGGQLKGIVVIDEFGESKCPFIQANGRMTLSWNGYPRETWIAGRWV